jgi:hypothetical protein
VRKETHIQFWWENLKKKDQLEDICIDRNSIKMDLKEMGWEGINWLRLAQGMGERRPL